MCLDTISRRKPPKSGWMWKVFNGKEDELYNESYGRTFFSNCKPLRLNQWIKSKKVMTEGGYPSGFHGFVTQRGAETWASFGQIKIRVRYRKGRLRGTQDGRMVIVADEIFIPAAKEK